MSVQKKNGRWYSVVYLGMKNGKQDVEWSKGFDKKTDAQLEELEVRKRVIQNSHKIYSKEGFSYVADRWLLTRQKTVAPTTYRQNKCYYDTYIEKTFETSLIKDIDALDITDFMVKMDKSPSTVNKAMNILKQIFDFAVVLKQINTNPCIGIKKPSIKRSKKTTWEPKTIKLFLENRDVKNSTCYIALMLLFSTGMRPGEDCGLRWIDWVDDYITPTVGIDEKREETDLKNDKAHDPIYLDIKLLCKLKTLKSTCEAQHLDAKKIFKEESYINYLLPDFRPMTVSYLHKRFDILVKRNGFPPTTLYEATRHSFGTNMMRDEVNSKMVADMMRHTTVRTTLDNYSHTDAKMYKDTVKRYNKKLL